RGRGKAVGFHPYDRPGTVFPLIDCHIADFRLMALWRELKPRQDLLPPKLARLTLRRDREGRRHVIAESAGEPWAASDAAARRAAPGPVRFIAARAEDVLATLPEPSAVVVNPPRGGLHWNVTLRLSGQPVPRIAYVSCDPATLARDLYRLRVNYRLTAVRAFDLFPQTAHVETVAMLEAA